MKRVHELDRAIREVIERSDQALGKVLSLSSARRSALTAFLARQFPVETMLREVASTRDKAVNQSPMKISAEVESLLRRQLVAAEPTTEVSRAAFWLGRLRSPLAAVLAVCALITVAFLGLGRWATWRSKARGVSPGPPVETITLESGIEPFVRTIAIGPFNLNTNEPASLQASFFANRKIRFSDGKNTPFGLRLDLPMTTASMEEGLARTP